MAERNGAMNGHATLDAVTIRHKRFAYSDKPLYRVYSGVAQFKLVEAESAYEAYEKAGIARPYKIEREHFYRYLALSPEQLAESDREAVAIDPQMPDADEMKTLLFAALGDMTHRNEAPFEEMAIADLKTGGPSPAAPPLKQPAPRPAAKPEAKGLSAQEVEALLSGEAVES